MKDIDFNALRDRAYKCACEHGFHDKALGSKYYLMLAISKLLKAVEANRKGKRADRKRFEKFNKQSVRKDFYESLFKDYIKDTVEDEFTDAVIRLLDLAGMRDYDIHSLMSHINCEIDNLPPVEYFCDTPFIEEIYNIVCEITRFDASLDMKIKIVIIKIFCLSKVMDIDLIWHIEQKMKFNELRPYKNNKKY